VNGNELNVIGYVRVSTEEQGRTGVGLEAQRSLIRAECQRRGWELVRFAEDVASGKTTSGRHGLADAITEIEHGDAEALVAAKLDRVSRSALDFANLADRAKRKHWALVVLDLGVDMTTPVGEMIAGVLSYMAQFERRLIGQRTMDALAVKRAQGVKLGQPRQPVDPVVMSRIRTERAAGHTLTTIADGLNEDGLLRADGVRWRQAQVGRVLSYDDPPSWPAAHQPVPVPQPHPPCDRCSRRAVAKVGGERLCKAHHEALLRKEHMP
jgi:DNA invertase Pin-like site-specific DNA recombinase